MNSNANEILRKQMRRHDKSVATMFSFELLLVLLQDEVIPRPAVLYLDRNSGSGADFVAGFLLGGAVFGTLAYVFAPQIRRSLLNEDEYGFRRAKRPIYYDEGLEKTRQTLNEKIGQLNSAIDNVSSRLRGGNNLPQVPVETDAEEAAL
ncbi:hypothetical protein DH2020_047736 [Rehmannia glutinosa]|uniref:Uncharacterized protein n=1 Tax=Rehmannia glutinosa TaxID=99300 RepID=A0ABR0U836_REHGL